jgi:hypothetical protein
VVRSRVSSIDAAAVTIGKRVVIMGVIVGSANGENDNKEHNIICVGAQINGAFLLYSVDIGKENLDSKKDEYLEHEISAQQEQALLERARCERTKIRGHLRLIRAQVLGDIMLYGADIEGELDLRDVDVRANITCIPDKLESLSKLELLETLVQRVNFETLNTTGNIDLTELTVTEDLILRDTLVRGRLKLCANDAKQKPINNQEHEAELVSDQKFIDRWTYTKIGGKLRLDAANISHLILSGDNFMEASPIRKPIEQDEVSVVLERAIVGRLEIVESLPRSLDLSNLIVGSWEWKWKEKDKEMLVLERSYPFRKSNYLAIEKDLRNKGRDEEADRIHVSMRQRDRKESQSWSRKLVDKVLWDLPTRYGTTSKRLFVLMLVLSIISVSLFSNPNSVEYDIAASEQRQPPVVHLNPEAQDWNIGNAIFFAVRLHVPIVSLGIDEEVRPSGLMLQAYAVAAVATSWVAWPLFIASLSGFLRNRN